MVRLNKNGGPKNPEKVDRLCALFTVGTHLINSIGIAMAKRYILISYKNRY